MSVSSPGFQSTLLMDSPLAPDPAAVFQDVAAVARMHGLATRAIAAPKILMFGYELGAMQVWVTHRLRPIRLTPFLDARRPALALLSGTEVLSRVAAHACSVTIHVSTADDLLEHDSAPSLDLAKTLGRNLTLRLHRRLHAGIVYESASQMLQTGDEFEDSEKMREAKARRPHDTRLSMHRPAQVQARKDLEARALDFINHQIRRGAHRPPQPPASRFDRLMTRANGRLEIEHTRAVRVVTMACASLTIALATVLAAAGGGLRY